MKPFPSFQNKIEAYEEEKRDENNPNSIQFTKRNASIKRYRERFNRKSKQKKLYMGHFALSKAKRSTFSWTPLPATNTTTTTTIMATNLRITTKSPPMVSSCKKCKRWEPSFTYLAQSAPHPSLQESDGSNEDKNGDRQRVRDEEKTEPQRKEEEKNKKEKVPNEYYPASPDYGSTYIYKTPCSIVVLKRKRPWTQTTTPQIISLKKKMTHSL